MVGRIQADINSTAHKCTMSAITALSPKSVGVYGIMEAKPQFIGQHNVFLRMLSDSVK